MDKMRRRLPAELLDFLQVAGRQAEAQGQRLYLVGGAVRDLLLGRPDTDFDLVLEGDAISFAGKLARNCGEHVTLHRKFGTAKFRRGDLIIDVVTARSETYASPGALPAVKPGTIRDDLFRRDFSINAMAIELTPACFGRLLDCFDGARDLERGSVRILHERSFIDDATRMLRAVRYEQRLGFELEADTERLLKRDLPYLDTISGDRVRHELELIAGEDNAERMLRRAQALGILRQIHPAVKFDEAAAGRFRIAGSSGSSDTALFFLLLLYPLDGADISGVTGRLGITGSLKRAAAQLPELKSSLAVLNAVDIKPSAVYRLLQRFDDRAVAACAAAAGDSTVRSHLQRYLSELRHVTPCLNGDSLQAMGVQPGRRLGDILRRLREERVDGTVTTRDDEIALVRKILNGC